MKPFLALFTRKRRVLGTAALLVSLSVASAAPARAQPTPSAAAQALFEHAKALMAAGKATEACPKFEESQRLDPGSGTLINLALCYEQTGRTASAWSTYQEAAASARASGNVPRERGARERAAALVPRLSKLVIRVPAVDASETAVTRDGVVVGDAQWGSPIPVDAGLHEIVVRAPGYRTFRTTVAVSSEGTTTTVEVPPLAHVGTPNAVAQIPPEAALEHTRKAEATERRGLGAQRVAALAVGGVGVAGIVVGSIFGARALSKRSEAEKTCTGTACMTDDGVEAGNDAHRAGNVSTVSLLLGAAGLAGGAALWLTAPRGTTEVGLTTSGVTVRGCF
jgi:hypothetical protein